MSRDYAKVSPLFWTGNTGRFIRKQGPVCQLAALYLITGPQATNLGIYHLPLVTLAHAIGCPIEGALKALRRLSEGVFCTYDEEAEWVWVHEMASYQIDRALTLADKRVKWVAKEWLSLPAMPMLARFYEKYASAFHLPKRDDLPSPFEAPSKPHRSQEQEQEQEQLQEKKPTPCAPSDASIASAPKKKRAKHGPIEFDEQSGTFNGLNGQMSVWEQAYPAVSVCTEMSKAAAWLIANPKNRKANYSRFLVNWLARAQDRAPRLGGGSSPLDTSIFKD